MWHDARGGIAESEEAAIARQQLSKHAPTATDTHATVEGLLEMVSSVQSMLRLYSVDQWEQLVNCMIARVTRQKNMVLNHMALGAENYCVDEFFHC